MLDGHLGAATGDGSADEGFADDVLGALRFGLRAHTSRRVA